MNDILPGESESWLAAEAVLRDWLFAYGYRNIRMPILETTDLFVRAVGEVTDIVEKEMYTFTDQLNNDSLALRPEGTAGCLRAVIEHNFLYNGAQKVWYTGPMFRHEKPQKGRYRQFHQVGVEALGFSGPDVDAEQLVMLADLWKRLGLTGVRLQINSLGDVASRQAHRQALIAYFEQHADSLDEEAKRRLYTNPLRILDTKNPALQTLVNQAPQLASYLDAAALQHFEAVQSRLTQSGIEFEINPRLVRGLDYYNYTVFEWVTDQLGTQGTIAGGGRYDGLIEQLGGKPTPACGFGIGLERVLLLLQTQQVSLAQPQLDVYLVHQGEAAATYSWSIAQSLRAGGLSVQYHCGGGSFKSQMKKADNSGAQVAILIGEEEVSASQITIKWLRKDIAQSRVSPANAVTEILAQRATQ